MAYGRAMDIEWEEPPKTARLQGARSGRYADFAAALEENPGKWAKVPMLHGDKRTPSSAAALAQNIRRGKVKGFKAGSFETAFEEGEVWARYVERGEDVDDDASEGDENKRSSTPPNELAPKVRRWAKRSGVRISERGRIPEHIIEEYLTEFPEDRSLRLVQPS